MKKYNNVLKMLKKIKKESDFQEYGWSDLEDDLTAVIEESKKIPCCGHQCCCNYKPKL